MFLRAVCTSPASPLISEKPLENRLLAGYHVMPVIMNYARTLMEFIYLISLIDWKFVISIFVFK